MPNRCFTYAISDRIYRHPGYPLAKVNVAKQQAFIQQLDMIKKLLDENTVLLSQDESHI